MCWLYRFWSLFFSHVILIFIFILLVSALIKSINNFTSKASLRECILILSLSLLSSLLRFLSRAEIPLFRLLVVGGALPRFLLFACFGLLSFSLLSLSSATCFFLYLFFYFVQIRFVLQIYIIFISQRRTVRDARKSLFMRIYENFREKKFTFGNTLNRD